jgi:rhodanese-related sulfurtransferase
MGQIAEFANGHPWLALAVVVSALAVIFYELRLRAQGVTHVPASLAVQLINKGALIVDVRKPEQYSAGHIVNARNVPLAELESGPEQKLKKSDKKIYLTVCDNGTVSGRAANVLRKAGYEKVFSLKGGLAAWRADNLPIVRAA